MIDLVDFKRKTIYRFDTDIQSAVEYFCISVIGYHYGKGGAIFSDPTDTDKIMNRKHMCVTNVKVRITKTKYKFEI